VFASSPPRISANLSPIDRAARNGSEEHLLEVAHADLLPRDRVPRPRRDDVTLAPTYSTGACSSDATTGLLIGVSLADSNYIPTLVSSPCTIWGLWAAAIGTVGVDGLLRARVDEGMITPDPLNRCAGWIRYNGILTAIWLGVLVLAPYVLPHLPATIVQVFAVFFVVIAGSQFFLELATFVSKALKGRRRTQFQVCLSLAVPIAFTRFLASRADVVPFQTLLDMFTPWLLIPLGVIGWVCWLTGSQLNREHPFRGFLIASAVLFVLCFISAMGMTTESDGEGSYAFLDPDKAKRARETGVYVWGFVLCVTVAYVALFLRWCRTQQSASPEIR